MALVDSQTPGNDVDAALQKETGNPKDFKFHEQMRMPKIEVSVPTLKGVEGRSSPIHGTEIRRNEGNINEDAEAARNRAMKQGKAGV